MNHANGFPYSIFFVMPCAFLVIFNLEMRFSGLFLMSFALYHSGDTSWKQLMYWWKGMGFYFNELMVKRIAVTGCFGLIYGRHLLESKQDDSQAGLTGILLETRTDTMSSKHSGVLLVARLFISGLFLFVGYGEIVRQLETHYKDAEGHMHHARPVGDGHDEMWAKLLQFCLSLPLILGFKLNWITPTMSVVCFLEALIQWQFWSASAAHLGPGYQIHAREHFCVNVAVSGGLLLLKTYGAGKYSVDAFMKKKN